MLYQHLLSNKCNVQLCTSCLRQAAQCTLQAVHCSMQATECSVHPKHKQDTSKTKDPFTSDIALQMPSLARLHLQAETSVSLEEQYQLWSALPGWLKQASVHRSDQMALHCCCHTHHLCSQREVLLSLELALAHFCKAWPSSYSTGCNVFRTVFS